MNEERAMRTLGFWAMFIKAELFRIFARKKRLFAALAASLFLGAAAFGISPGAAFPAAYALMFVPAAFAFGEEGGTLKNLISSGLGRTQVYLGKLAVSLIFSAVFTVAFTLPALFAGGFSRLLTVALALTAGTALACLLNFFMSPALVPIAYIGLTAALPLAAQGLLAVICGGCVWSYSLIGMVVNPTLDAAAAWLAGLAWTALITAAGLLRFSRAEIK